MSTASPPRRVVIEDVAPQVAHGRYPVKRVVGEPVAVRATVYADGHDELHVVLGHRAPGSRGFSEVPMVCTNPGLDQWEASFVPLSAGLHRFRVLGWIDPFASWRRATARKLEAGQDISSDLVTGAALVQGAAASAPRREAAKLAEAAAAMREGNSLALTDTGGETRASTAELMRARLRRADAAVGDTVEVLVEREKAMFSAWYELFPRSWSTEPHRRPHGTLRDVAERLDYVAEMGFDVLYLPPIHPIGTTHRKGPDNVESTDPSDPGSPWAIGGAEGGHTAIHPELGTLEDLDDLVRAAADNGIDVALDLALQCSPDHPWVREHPEWFRHRPDGSIQYAENPPKRYEDIYPLDFECSAWHSLWEEVLAVARFWLERGIRIFRVDNPHTKPFAFWEWLIAEIRSTHPDTILLAEAFTRPRVMHRLAQLGFTQSYTYFAWRESKWELTEYFTELTTPPSVDELRPNVWPNTPDILPWHLQGAPSSVNAARLVLAATLSASYGIYGPAFELADNRPAGNGKEEYASSEKYEIREWDLADQSSIRDLVSSVNAIRYRQLALHTNRTLRFHDVDAEALVCYSKTTHDGPDPDPARSARNPVLVVVNLDGRARRNGTVSLDLGALGIDGSRPYEVHDLLDDRRFDWQGDRAYVELDPVHAPAHIMRVSQMPEAIEGEP